MLKEASVEVHQDEIARLYQLSASELTSTAEYVSHKMLPIMMIDMAISKLPIVIVAAFSCCTFSKSGSEVNCVELRVPIERPTSRPRSTAISIIMTSIDGWVQMRACDARLVISGKKTRYQIGVGCLCSYQAHTRSS